MSVKWGTLILVWQYCNLRRMEEEGIVSDNISDDEPSNLYKLHSVLRIL
jgi:hypothetical protein